MSTTHLPPFSSGSATIIDSTAYYLGGMNATGNSAVAFYTIDLTLPFPAGPVPATSNWIKKNSLYNFPALTGNTLFAGKGEVWNVGGYVAGDSKALVLQKNWTSPSTTGTTPPPLSFHSVAVDQSTNTAYFWGGIVTGKNVISTMLWTFDSVNYKWDSSPTASGRYGHTATLVKGIMYIIGGTEQWGEAIKGRPFTGDPNITNDILPIFFTTTNTWSTRDASGVAPLPRHGHAAVMHPDGVSIIIDGGFANIITPGRHPYVPRDSSMFLFNTDTNTWSQPQVHIPPGGYWEGRANHSAVVIENTLLTFFGVSAFDLDALNSTDVLDLKTWHYQTNYTPPRLSKLAKRTYFLVSNASLNTSASPAPCFYPAIAPLATVGVAGICIATTALVAGALFFFRCSRRSRRSPFTSIEKERILIP